MSETTQAERRKQWIEEDREMPATPPTTHPLACAMCELVDAEPNDPDALCGPCRARLESEGGL